MKDLGSRIAPLQSDNKRIAHRPDWLAGSLIPPVYHPRNRGHIMKKYVWFALVAMLTSVVPAQAADPKKVVAPDVSRILWKKENGVTSW